MSHQIPEYPVQYGGSWMQPDRYDILLTEENDVYAYMSEKTLSELIIHTYTLPSYLFPGKMWRAYDCTTDIHLLFWVSHDGFFPGSAISERLKTHRRVIKIHDWKALLGVQDVPKS